MSQNMSSVGRFLKRHRQMLFVAASLLLLTTWQVIFAQGTGDPFQEAGQQGCVVINFIFRGFGAAIILGIVWAFALWTLFTQKGAIWGLGIAIVVSLIIQFAPAFIGFFAPAVTSTCFS